ncbi:DUF7017 domain-containing protein [Pseudogemmobacter bohemicus]|uniref:DUF7017 domain-containing protein n=1 Tax=Pseudogemmobacter bohemicus TaxID=2250708 RepID=UPI000DD37B64|nr:hypothetical protein [Pseudogemmobacter bohemicus]
MTTAKEVNAIRKAGNLDLAYRMAAELISAPEADDWDRAAWAWCVIALAKRAAGTGDTQELTNCLAELRAFEVPQENALLAEHREKALALSQPGAQDLRRAKDLSKQGRHADAVAVYEGLARHQNLALADRQSWGWDIFRLILADLRIEGEEKPSPSAVQRTKRRLKNYLDLGLKGPNRLHSAILQQALRLAKADSLKILPFLRLWGLDQFAPEDFEVRPDQTGKPWPALFETTVLAAASEATKAGQKADMQFVLPLLEDARRRFTENIWLEHSYVKLLRGLGRLAEAREHAIKTTRAKASEYWAWDLLGDLETENPDLQTACYARALCCSQDDDFVGKLRIKFASIIGAHHPSEARAEVDRVQAHRTTKGYKSLPEAEALQNTNWYCGATAKAADRAFYQRFTEPAEALLFSHLPWVIASVGDIFEIPAKDGQKPRKRRRIYIRQGKVALETSLSAAHPDLRSLKDGAPVSVQHEHAQPGQDRLTIHRIRPRPEGAPMDAAPEVIGVIDNVNLAKSVLHAIASREVDGTAPLAEFPGRPEVGMPVALRLAVHHGPKGTRKRILSIQPSNQPLPPGLCEDFLDYIEVTDRGFGFTGGDIFIPPGLISGQNLETGDYVQGKAILNQNKQGKWGMKAIDVLRLKRDFTAPPIARAL